MHREKSEKGDWEKQAQNFGIKVFEKDLNTKENMLQRNLMIGQKGNQILRIVLIDRKVEILLQVISSATAFSLTLTALKYLVWPYQYVFLFKFPMSKPLLIKSWHQSCKGR